jgi:hypothetical protein
MVALMKQVLASTTSTTLPERAGGGGGGEWEPIKILLEGDRGSNKMNMASNTRL